MNSRTILKILLLALATVLFAGFAQAQVELRFDPVNPTVGMGETTRLGVYLDDALDVRTIELTVAYDNTLLSSVGGGSGALYGAIPGSPTVWEDFDDSTPGQWTAYAVVFGASNYATGPGELFYWDVEGLIPGSAAISAVSVAIYDVTGSPIAGTTLSGTTLEVLPPIGTPSLDAEPDFTPGTENSLSWNDVGADEYQVQAATDAGFTSIVGDTGWFVGTSHTFTGLADGQTYYYRVQARVAVPAYETGWDTGTVSSTQDATPPSSQAESLATYQTSLTFEIPWTGADTGSGLGQVELWADGGSGFTLYDTITDPGTTSVFNFTAPGEGSYSFYTVAADGVGNAESAPVAADATTMVDVTAPTGDLLINGGATLTNDPSVTLTNSVSGATEVRYQNDGGGWTPWEGWADTRAWDLTGPEGLLAVNAEFRDPAGNVLAVSDDITLDTTPPSASFVINADATETNSTGVTLTSTSLDAVQMQFSNDGTTFSSLVPYADSYLWTIDGVEGLQTVTGRYLDAAGNQLEVTDSILYDITPPSGTMVINNDDEFTTLADVTVNSSVTEAVEMQFSNDGVTFSGWTAYAGTSSWTLGGPEGSNTVYAQYRDAAGNVLPLTDAITLDTIPPEVSFVINGGDPFSGSTAVTLNISNTDAVQMQFSNDGVTFSGWVPMAANQAWILPDTEGDLTVHGQFLDIAGNLTETTDSIIYDITPPSGTLVVNGGTEITNSLGVVLTSSVVDAVQMQFSNDGVTFNGWVPYQDTYAWDLAGPDGLLTVSGQYADAAGNILDLSDSITLDTVPPGATMVVDGDASYALSTSVILNSTSLDAVQMQFSNDGVTYSGWVDYADNHPWMLAGPDGLNTVSAQYRDAAGNITDVADSITLDTMAPTATLVINGDDPLTGNTTVTLDLVVAGGAEMRFSNDGINFEPWIAVAPSAPWTLDGPDGTVTVYGEIRDEAGNVTPAQDSILLDTTPPDGSFLVNGGDAFTGDISVTLDLSVNGAVTMEFSNNGTLWSDPVAYAATAPWTLEGDDGLKTVHARFNDEAGNQLVLTDEITLDRVAPTGGFVINNDDTYTTDAAVTLNISVAGAAEMRFSNDGATWSGWTAFLDSYPWTLSGPDGDLSVFGEFRDGAGNLLSASDLISLDTEYPVAAMVINNGDAQTNTTAVTLNSATTGATQMRFSNDGATWTGWAAFAASQPWTLSGPDGLNTVYAQYRDDAGNLSPAQDEITLDTQGPTGTFAINGGATVTGDAGVTLTMSVSGADQMQFSNDGTNWSPLVDYGTPWSWTLTPGDGLKTVHARFVDNAGNELVLTQDITLDTSAPTGGFVINDDDTYTTDAAVTLSMAVTGASEMRFSDDGATWSTWTAFADTRPWNLPGPDGALTVFGQFRDEVGNSLDASDSIILDTVVPVAAMVINNDEELTNSTSVNLNSATTGATQMRFSDDGASWSGWTDFAATQPWTLAGPDGLNTVYAQYRDDAGNLSPAQDTITLDTAAPTGGFVVNNDDAYTTDTAVTLNISVAGATQMQFSNDGTNWSALVTQAATYAWNLEGADGSKTVHGRFLDLAGNILEPSDDIILDTTAPTGTMVINGDQPVTNNPAVLLTATVTGADQMQFSNDGVTWSDLVAFATNYDWTLAPGDGTKTVHGRFIDAAGLELQVSDTIDLDTTAPDVPVLAGEPAFTPGSDNTLDWNDIGASDYYLEGATDSAFSSGLFNTGWIAGTSHVFTGLSDGQIYFFRLKARDDLGNETEWSASVFSTQDNTAPISAAGPVNGFQTSLTFDIPWSGSDATSGLQQVELFVDTGSGWVSAGATTDVASPVPFSYTAATEGVFSFATVATDVAGLVEVLPATADATTEVDTTAPSGTFVINADAASTGTPDVTLDVMVTGAESMRFSNNANLWDSPESAWQPHSASVIWTLSGGDGIKTVYAQFRDAAGNLIDSSDDILLDTTAPDLPVLAGEPEYTAGAENTLNWNDIGAAGYFLVGATDASFTSGLFNSDWITGTSHTFTALADGQIFFYRMKARDDLGNESDWSASVFSTQDATAPVSSAGPLDSFQASLTFDVPWTGSDATSGLQQVELFVDAGSGWVSAGTTTNVSSPVPFSYSASGEGVFSFATVATDQAGLVEDLPVGPDTTTEVDLTAPQGVMVINGDDLLTGDPAVQLDLAVTGASQMQFSNDGTTFGPLVDYADTFPWTLEGPDGLLTVHGRFIDQAGNELLLNDDIELDTMSPEGTLLVNNDAPVTSSPDVTLNSAVTGAVQMQFSNDGTTYSELTAYADTQAWTLSPGDGTKTVYGRYVDGVGNMLEVSDSIELDTTAPAVPVIIGEPTFTAGLSNTVMWNSTGASAYFAEAATDPGFASVAFSTGWTSNTFFEFSGLSDGQQYFYRVKAQDDLGNESDWSGAVNSTQDATAPASDAGPLDSYQTTLTFAVPWTANDAVSGIQSVELFASENGGAWTSVGTTTSVEPPEPFNFTAQGEGNVGFYLVARDHAGNLEGAAGAAEVSTTVDLTNPAGTLAINGGDQSTASPNVVLNSAVTDLNGVTHMRFTNTDGDWPLDWVSYAETSAWILPEGDGVKTVFGQYRDAAGNIAVLSDDIALDTTPPGLPVLLAEPDFTMGLTNEVTWSDTGAATYLVQVAASETFGVVQAESGWITELGHTFSGLDDGQAYWYRVRGRDELNNETDWSAMVSSIQDATAPSSAADPMPPFQGVADITVTWTASDESGGVPSGVASVELFVSTGTVWESVGVATQIDPPEAFVYTAPEAGTYRFYTVATDMAGNSEIVIGSIDASTTVDFTAPAPVVDLDAIPGLQQVSLTWTNPDESDLADIEVWSARWDVVPGTSAYPEYDDIAEEPALPASRSAAEADEAWNLVGTLPSDAQTFTHGEGMDSRGVYYYQVFIRDHAGNFSAPADGTTRAVNYLLGDLNNDDDINVFDITSLGATYGLSDGDQYYNSIADIGPTDDGSGQGVPQTDDIIAFEDLAIMALNYILDKTAVKVEGSEAPALTWYQVNDTSWVLGLLEPCSSLKALNLRAQVPEHVSVTVEAGAALGNFQDYFLGNVDRHGLDAGFAVLGRGAVLPVEGEILMITTSEPVDLSGASVEARDMDNSSLEFSLLAEPLQVLPKAYSLAANYPNPFNPLTTIAFDLPQAQRVKLVIYDLKGRLVQELVNEPMEAGSHSVTWTGTDRAGRRVASGVYFYRIQAGPLQDTKRMMLVK